MQNGTSEAGETQQYVFDVTTDGFAEQVIERSKTVPVVVDFWAAWCAPCRQLGPVLERAVAARQGQVLLAKVDTDAQQALAQRYRISGIPAVKAFYKGRVVNEFVGARDPRFVATFLDSLQPSPGQEAMEHATALLSERDYDGAVALLKPLIDGGDSKLEPEKRDQIRLMLAEVYMARGPQFYAEVGPLLEGLDARSQEAERAELLRQVLDFFKVAEEASGDEEARLSDEKDAAARYILAAKKARGGEYGAAFKHLLWLVTNNRKFRDDAGRRAMLALFQYLGSDQEEVHEYRRRLQVIL